MSDVQRDRTTQQSVDDLTVAVGDNTRALNRVKRRYRYLVAALLVVGMMFKFNYDGIVSRCNTGNELRAQIDEKFESVAEGIVDTGIAITPEVQQVIDDLQAPLVPRQCDDIDWLGR